MYLARLKRLLANKGAGRHIWSDHYLAAKHPFSPLSRVNTCYWVSGAQLTAGGRRWAHSASEVDKVVAGEVVEVLGAYHVAGHNSDRLSHPDSPTGGAAIYPGLQPDALHLMRRVEGVQQRSVQKGICFTVTPSKAVITSVKRRWWGIVVKSHC